MAHATLTPDIFLTKVELASLTGKVRHSAQARALALMAIEYKVRPDGSIAVLRDHIQKVFDGAPDVARRKARTPQPNWDAI